MKSREILLTGGTGFFGRALLRYWLHQAEEGKGIANVCVLSRNPQNFLKLYPEFSNHSWLNFHQGDILYSTSLPEKGQFSHVLHAASDSTIGPQLTPLERYVQIVDGTRNLLDYATKKNISRVLLISSGAVYGPQPLDMVAISENYNGMPDPLRPENGYSVAKRCAEHLCALYRERHGIEILVARCFSFVGRDLPLNVHFAIGNFINDALKQKNISIDGDGRPIRTYLDQRDLARWLIKIMYEGHDGEAYNVGSDVAVTIEELAILVRDTLAPGKKILINNKASDGNFRNKYIPDISKARKQLHLEINYSLKQAIYDAVKK